MKLLPKRLCRAFTLVEVMMTMGSGTIVLAAITTAGVALQRSFAAVQSYSVAEGDQLRVLDYISMDCRRARNATVSNNVLTLTVPAYYDNSGTAQTPVLDSSTNTISYNSGATVTIAYSMSITATETNFVRSVTQNGTTATTIIARNVASFTVSPQDLTSSISCNIMFFPTFTRNTGAGTWRSGGTAPDGTVGSDGDYYVIDASTTTPSTLGDVYYKSAGSYTLVKNIKATNVYCNTFFRNAIARQ
jgi:Tfp pilus assembly protein PilW